MVLGPFGLVVVISAELAVAQVTQSALNDSAAMERDRQRSQALSQSERGRALRVFDQAFSLYQAGDFDAAKVGFERGLGIDPGNGDANFYLGDIFMRRGEQEGARSEGRNLVIEFRNAEGRIDRLRELAAELGRGNFDVLLAFGSEFNLVALEQASRDTPIVMIAADYDPVATGHIASLARPGGRITGVSPLQSELPAKRLELLKDLLPKAERIAVLADSATVGQLEITQATAKRLGVALKVHEFKRAPYDYEGAFAEFVQAKADAVLALASGLFVPARRLIPELALKHRLPSMFNNYLWAEAGGLLTYGVSFPDLWRRAADKVALVLQGATPADLPVEQPSTVELVINLKTLKALGITIPQSLRVRIDRVIE